MSGSLSYFKRVGQTIVARATAIGGPVAVLRVSGEKLQSLPDFLGPLPKAGTFELRELKVKNKNSSVETLDRALLLYFEAPHSFTGENVLEIQCHGVESTVAAIEAELFQGGVLAALPGEFSFRAVMNKKMTLAEAEALQSAFALEGIGAFAASKLLGAGKSGEKELNENLEKLLTKLSSARGRIEAAIDFPEAEEEQSREILSAQGFIEEVQKAQARLLSSYQNFCAQNSKVELAIIGQANAGKSTLFNILCGGKKALVSELPGTTRDVVEGRLHLRDGTWLSLYDTAGLRMGLSTESKDSHEQIEASGIELGLEVAKRCRFLIWVKSAAQDENPHVRSLLEKLGKKHIEVYSHADAADAKKATGAETFNLLNEKERLTDWLLGEIEKNLRGLCANNGANTYEEDFILSARQASLLENSFLELKRAQASLSGILPIEVAGEHVRASEELLRKALGQELSDEYIGQIFSQFCLGK